MWKSTRQKNPSDNDIADMLKRFLGVDGVIAIGRDKVQPSLMFHLDQAMIPLGDGRIGVTRVAAAADDDVQDDDEIEEVNIFLAELRQRLSMLGYRLIDIDTSPTNVRNHQYYDGQGRPRCYTLPKSPGGHQQGLSRSLATIRSCIPWDALPIGLSTRLLQRTD